MKYKQIINEVRHSQWQLDQLKDAISSPEKYYKLKKLPTGFKLEKIGHATASILYTPDKIQRFKNEKDAFELTVRRNETQLKFQMNEPNE